MWDESMGIKSCHVTIIIFVICSSNGCSEIVRFWHYSIFTITASFTMLWVTCANVKSLQHSYLPHAIEVRVLKPSSLLSHLRSLVSFRLHPHISPGCTYTCWDWNCRTQECDRRTAAKLKCELCMLGHYNSNLNTALTKLYKTEYHDWKNTKFSIRVCWCRLTAVAGRELSLHRRAQW